MSWRFSARVWEWRGPAPHHFVSMPDEASADLADDAASLSYGWGAIPVDVRIGETSFTTSVFPKDGVYIVPLKVAVRRAEGIEVGDEITLDVGLTGRRKL
ncbi:MAG: hypothetical protein RL205_369 [Actinomycetota bacterium]